MYEKRNCVVIVDDDESFSRAISRLLRAAGYETLLYSSAEEFLHEHSLSEPACVVLDVHLGGMSGLELQQKLGERGTASPIVFVTAHDDPECQERAQQAGCIAYLRKPVSKVLLLDAIRKTTELAQ